MFPRYLHLISYLSSVFVSVLLVGDQTVSWQVGEFREVAEEGKTEGKGENWLDSKAEGEEVESGPGWRGTEKWVNPD